MDLTSILFLGSGSNLVLPNLVEATVIRPRFSQIEITSEDDKFATIEVGSGVEWNEFVQWSLKNHFYGLENLSLIPGTVGASPIQNIGAYGVEVKDFIIQVNAYDFTERKFVTYSNSDCAFDYRHSKFKESDRRNTMICSVVFKLKKTDCSDVSYVELKNYLTENNLPIRAEYVRDAVVAIRSKKLPDPKVIGNVGSFFKNPIVSKSKLLKLQSEFPNIVSYPYSDDRFKLAAGWLIDQLGFKGHQLGEVKMFETQALVMVNCGRATRLDVENLRDKIRTEVHKKFDVDLETEPIFW